MCLNDKYATRTRIVVVLTNYSRNENRILHFSKHFTDVWHNIQKTKYNTCKF